jgi:hypothetical protein
MAGNNYGFAQGELYQIKKDMSTSGILHHILTNTRIDRTRNLIDIKPEQYFIFVGTIIHEENVFSKILLDNQIIITYNPYHLSKVSEKVPPEKRKDFVCPPLEHLS